MREVDLLGRLRALELVDLKRVTIDTAKEEACRVSGGIATKANTQRHVECADDECAAYLRCASMVLNLSTPASSVGAPDSIPFLAKSLGRIFRQVKVPAYGVVGEQEDVRPVLGVSRRGRSKIAHTPRH